MLVDGYRRIAALRRLGRDTALIERWRCDVAQALINVLAHGRAFAAIDEAMLLRELTDAVGLSQHVRISGLDVLPWRRRRDSNPCYR